jgi:hypothetical protein
MDRVTKAQVAPGVDHQDAPGLSVVEGMTVPLPEAVALEIPANPSV